MKAKHVINFHKGTSFIFILGLMLFYQNFGTTAYIYLALHGTYGIMWLLKDRMFPDKQWELKISIPQSILILIFISLYWVAPFLLISRGVEASPPLIAAAVSLNLMGVFLHYSSDAQKYYTLKYNPGLITNGFFARCRNTNYMGEVFIYLAFAMLAQHWLPYLIMGIFFAIVFVPNMLKKDKSLSRYPGFEEYKSNSGLLIPKLFGTNADTSENKTTANVNN